MRRKERTLTVGRRESTGLDAPGGDVATRPVGRHWWGRTRSAPSTPEIGAMAADVPFDELDERDLEDEIVELLVDEVGSIALRALERPAEPLHRPAGRARRAPPAHLHRTAVAFH